MDAVEQQKAKRREASKKWRLANPDKVKAYRREYGRVWHQRNKEAVRAYLKEWRRQNPEKAKAQRRRKYLRARDRLRAEYKLNRVEIILRKHGADLATPEGAALVRRHDDGCSYCGIKEGILQVDHRIPTSRGGGSEMSNLQWLCGRCNIAKSDMTEEEFFAHISKVLFRRAQ